MAQCAGVKAKGGRCTTPPLRGEEWCFGHHPGYADTRRRNAAKSHKNRSASPEIARIKDKLATLADGVMQGGVDRGDAAVCAQVYNVLLRAVTVELKIKETGELEARLEELAAGLERQQQKGGGGYSFTG